MVFACNGAVIWSVISLFLLSLGATPFHLGLLETGSRGGMAVRLLAAHLLSRIGKVRLMVLCRTAMLLPVAFLATLALRGSDDGGTSIWLALAVMVVVTVFSQAGNTAWWPLVQDNTTKTGLGGFLSRMHIRQRSIDLVLPLVIGWYLGTDPSSRHFAPLFALSIGANLLASFIVRKISEPAAPVADSHYWRRLVDAARLPALRRYGLFAIAYGLVTAAILPFWVVVLSDAGMGAVYFVWMTSVSAFGQIVALPGWGRLIDAHGSRSTLSLALVSKGFLGLAWLAIPADPLLLVLWATAQFFLWGILTSGSTMAQNRVMMDAVPAERQAEGFALAVLASAVGGAVGGLAGGVALQWFTPTAGGWDPRLGYLAGVQMTLIAVWYLGSFLSGHGEQRSLSSLVLARNRRNDREYQ